MDNAPKYKKVIISSKGVVNRFDLNNYHSPKKITDQNSTHETEQIKPGQEMSQIIRITDDKTFNSPTKAPADAQQQSQRTLVKISPNQAATSEQGKISLKNDSNVSFGTNNEKVLKKPLSSPLVNQLLPSQFSDGIIRTKEQVQEMLENTNSGNLNQDYNKNWSSNVTYTPPKIPGVNSSNTQKNLHFYNQSNEKEQPN